MEDIPTRVARGLAWLEQNYPGGLDRLEPKQASIISDPFCVLEYCTGLDYTDAIRLLPGYVPGEVVNPITSAHGFMYRTDGLYSESDTAAAIDAEWCRQLTARRERLAAQ